MKKILFIVTESRSANGICVKAVMDELTDRGNEVFCLTNRELGDGKSDDVRNGVTYSTVKPRLCYRLDARAASLPKGSKRRRLISLMSFALNKAKLVLTYPTWPLISPAYAGRIYRKAKSICKTQGIDTVIPIYTQIDTLIAAEKIKRKLPDVEYVPYFLDAFSGGYGPKVFSKEWTVKRGLKWEAKLLPRADKIVMMRSVIPHYEKYKDKITYYDKIRFLDLPLFKPTESCVEAKKDRAEGEERVTDLLFVGSIPAHIRDPRYFIELFGKLDDPALRFTIIGTSTCESYLEEAARKDERIRLVGRVDHKAALASMSSADALVNLGNNDPKMTPSKIFEYMSCGKPIISTAPIENEPSKVYLENYPCKYIIDERKPIEEHIEPLKRFLSETRGASVNAERLSEIFCLNTPAAFAECISEE